MLKLTAKISEHVLCMHSYRTPGEDAGMVVSSFFTIQKCTIMSSRWLHSQWVLLWDILCHWEEACNFHYQMGLLVPFQCYGTFDVTKWFRVIKTLHSFSICRDAKNGGWGYSRRRGSKWCKQLSVSTTTVCCMGRSEHGVANARS